MRCPKCSYFFSEELKTCPRCGADMGSEIEKLGIFPPIAEEPFLTIDDFMKRSMEERAISNQERVIEFPFPESES